GAWGQGERVRGGARLRLRGRDVPDVLNVFQVTGLTPEGRYFVKPSPGRKGDYLEFFAEIDVLCAISVCPHGDLSVPVWGKDAADANSVCHPLGVEIWEPSPESLAGWTPPRASDYAGANGFLWKEAGTASGPDSGRTETR